MATSAKFAELRALRASGKKRLATYEVEAEDDIYEEVDEERYKEIVRHRLDQEDFVTDDNGAGYADDGREEWSNTNQYDSASESDELPARGKIAKRKREEDKARQESIHNGINKYFSRGSAATVSKPKVSA